MSYLIYIIFGALPSAAWLLFYLRKDVHPESNKMILKIFFYGMLVALPVVLIEIGIIGQIGQTNLPPVLITALNMFLGVALVEEICKYLVVRGKVLKSHEFDEPIDAVLYMIIAALGFAAIENILILFSLGPVFLMGPAVSLTCFRFLGATLLHALCSGLLGYHLALSICEGKNNLKHLFSGFLLAILLHGLYNFSIMEVKGGLGLIIPVIILLGLTIFLTFAFKRLKKLKSVCLPSQADK